MSQPGQGLREVTAGGVRWQVLPEWRDLLLGPEGLRLEDWLRDGLARIVKHGPHRTVYHVRLQSLSFYLKHFRLADARDWLRQLFRPAKARMEFDKTVAVADRRVPTVLPVALGERCHGPVATESFLITRSLDGTEPLNLFLERTLSTLESANQTRLRQRLARALGAFVARLHDAGIVHQDLHPANLLVDWPGEERLQLHLIDLHAVSVRAKLCWASARANLVMLNRWFSLRSNRSDRLRFWRAYCRNRHQGELPASVPLDAPHLLRKRWPREDDLAREIEERTHRSNASFWRRRDRRSLRSNRYYRRLRSPGFTGWIVRELSGEDLAPILKNPDAVFADCQAVKLKDSPSSTVAEFDLSVGGIVRRVILKRFRLRTWKDPLTAIVRPPAALRSWVNGHGLGERALPTARPLALLLRRSWGLIHEGYLLTEKILAADDLHGCLRELELLPPVDQAEKKRGLIERLATLVRGLHERQVSHRDLKAANLLVNTDGIWLIDLVGVSLAHQLSRGRRLQNISRLHASFHHDSRVTRTDKLRFLRTYLRWGLFGKAGWKAWWQEIANCTQKKVLRNLRSGRPLR